MGTQGRSGTTFKRRKGKPFHQLHFPLAGTQTPVAPPAVDLSGFTELPENRLALAAIQALVLNPESVPSPLFLHGPTGVGKSRLLQAAANLLQRRESADRVVFLGAGDFAERCDEAWQGRDSATLHHWLWDAAAVLIDDLPKLAGRPAALEELRHLCDAFELSAKPLLLAGSLSPAELSGFPPELRSRLRGGLVIRIDPPGPDSLRAVFTRRCQELGILATRQAQDHLCREVRDLRELLGVIGQLDATLVGSHRKLGIEHARTVLEEVHAAPLDIATIAKATAARYRVSLTDLRSASRRFPLTEARQTAMHLARLLTASTLAEIGAFFGGRDHTTVLHACRKTEARLPTDDRLAADVRSIRRTLGNSVGVGRNGE
jgi:chromosomal replication initiator protein